MADHRVNLDVLSAAIADGRRRAVRDARRKYEAELRSHEREKQAEIEAGGDGNWYDENPPEYDTEGELMGNLASQLAYGLLAIAERLDRDE